MASGDGLPPLTDAMRPAQIAVRPEQFAEVARLSGLGEIAAALAHQLSQPLGAIANYAAVALYRLPGEAGGGELRHCLEQIAEQASRAGETVQKLRALAEPAGSRAVPVDVNALVREAAALLEHHLRFRQIELKLDLDNRLPETIIKPVQIQCAIAALIENAAEAVEAASPEDRRVRVRTSTSGEGELEVAVEDAAVSLPPEMAGRVCEPFFSTKPGRLGLGLTAVHWIVETHGGRLEAECRGGEATVFRFILPVAKGG